MLELSVRLDAEDPARADDGVAGGPASAAVRRNSNGRLCVGGREEIALRRSKAIKDVRLLLAVSNLGSHTTLFASNFATAFSGLFSSHREALLLVVIVGG